MSNFQISVIDPDSGAAKVVGFKAATIEQATAQALDMGWVVEGGEPTDRPVAIATPRSTESAVFWGVIKAVAVLCVIGTVVLALVIVAASA